MYEIIFSDSALKQLNNLEKNIQERIISTLERIRIRPESYLIRLVDDPGYKLRAGDYRLIIDLDKEKLIILVIKIEHRKNVYKR